MAVVGTLLTFGRKLWPFCKQQAQVGQTMAVCVVCMVASALLFLMQPLLVRSALDLMFSPGATYVGLYWECLLMLANYVALHAVRQYGLFRQGVLAQQLVEHVRLHAFAEVIAQGHVAVERRGIGAVQSMLTSDVAHLQSLVRNHITNLFNGIVFSVGGLAVCVALQPFLTLFVVLLLAPMAFIMKRFDAIGKGAGKQIQNSLSDTMDSVSEALQCTKEMDAYGTKASEVEALRRRGSDHMRIVREQLISIHIFKGVGGVVAGFVIVGVILAGGHQALRGTLQAADLIAFVYYAVEIRNHATKLFESVTEALVAISACDDVVALAQLGLRRYGGAPSHTADNDNNNSKAGKTRKAKASDSDESNGTAINTAAAVDAGCERRLVFAAESDVAPLSPLPDRPAVLLAGTTVYYNGSPDAFDTSSSGSGKNETTAQPVAALVAVNLRVSVGEVVGVVGVSGSGKTTLINLLMGFCPPSQGTVQLFGHPITDDTVRALRLHIGYVSQSPRLVRGTVLDNIRYGQLTATDAECKEAASVIGCDTFVRDLEHGWNTVLGKGVQLSGGQMARLSLARALVRHPRLLLLDEVTSALDAQSEQLVLDGVFNYCNSNRGVSAVIVTHKQHIAARCHRVCMLEHGRVVQEGAHVELLAGSAPYKRLWRAMGAQRE